MGEERPPDPGLEFANNVPEQTSGRKIIYITQYCPAFQQFCPGDQGK